MDPVCKLSVPVDAGFIIFNWSKVWSVFSVTVPVYAVIPVNAAATSDELPDNVTLFVFRVIAPVVALLIAFNSDNVCGSSRVIFACPVLVTAARAVCTTSEFPFNAIWLSIVIVPVALLSIVLISEANIVSSAVSPIFTFPV